MAKESDVQRESQTTSESGGVVSFVLFGLLLMGLLAGGLYLIFGRSAQIAQQPPQIVQQDESQEGDQPAQAEPDAEDQPASPQDQPATETPRPAQPPASASDRPAQTPPATQPGTPIAETGPTETFATMLALGTITGSAVMYAQSRRS